MPDPRDVSVYKLLFEMVSVLVDRPESVIIKTQATEDGTNFTVHVHPDDTGKLVGKRQFPPRACERSGNETPQAL